MNAKYPKLKLHSLSAEQAILLLYELDSHAELRLSSEHSAGAWWLVRPWIGTFLYNTYNWDHPFICQQGQRENLNATPLLPSQLFSLIQNLRDRSSQWPTQIKYSYKCGKQILLSITGNSESPRSHIQEFMKAYSQSCLSGKWKSLGRQALQKVPPVSEEELDVLSDYILSMDNELMDGSAFCRFMRDLGLEIDINQVRKYYFSSFIVGYLFASLLRKLGDVSHVYIDCSTDPLMQGLTLGASHLMSINTSEIIHGTIFEEAYTPWVWSNYPPFYPRTYIVTDSFQEAIYKNELKSSGIMSNLDIREVPLFAMEIHSSVEVRSKRILLVENTGTDTKYGGEDVFNETIERVCILLRSLNEKGMSVDIRPHPVWGLNPEYTKIVESFPNVNLVSCHEALSEAANEYQGFILPFESSSWKELVALGRPLVILQKTLASTLLSKRGLVFEAITDAELSQAQHMLCGLKRNIPA